MKKITINLVNGKIISSVLANKEADELMDQYYKLCCVDIDDNCFELSLKDEMDHLENILVPFRNILYISCRNDHES